MSDAMGDRIKARQFREETVKRVRDLASRGKIFFSDHAFDRVDERDIDALMAKRILIRGDLKDEVITAGRNKGEWKLTMVDRLKPNRDAGVVVVVVEKKCLRVVTVKWIDL